MFIQIAFKCELKKGYICMNAAVLQMFSNVGIQNKVYYCALSILNQMFLSTKFIFQKPCLAKCKQTTIIIV